MPDQYYGGAPTAFQGGMEFGAAQRARRIKENALNALIARYGPEAADPAAALAMQTMQQRAQMFPLDVQEARRIDAARQAMVQEYGAVAGDPAAQARDVELEDRDNLMRLQAGRRAALVLKQARANKRDIGSAFDFVQQALPAIGVKAEHLGVIRESLVSDPDSVDDFVKLLEDPNGQKALSGGQPMINDATGKIEWVVPTESGARVLPGYTPATAYQAGERVRQGEVRLQQGDRKLTNEEAKMRGFNAPEGMQIWETPDGVIHAAPIRGSVQEQTVEKNLREADAADEKFLKSFGAIQDHGDVVLNGAAAAAEYFKGAPDGMVMQNLRRLAPIIAGIPAHDAWQAIKEIQNNISIDELQRMRQSSPTGGAMGAVSDRDIELLQGALGRLDVIRDPKEMVTTLERISATYNRIIAAAQRDATAAQQRMQNRPRRETPPPPSESRYRPENPFVKR